MDPLVLKGRYMDHFFREYFRLFEVLPNHKMLRVMFEKRADAIYRRCPDPYDIEKAAPYMLELMKLYQRIVAWHEYEERKKNAQSRYQPRRKNGWLSSM